MKRYRLTVDQAAIACNGQAIHVHDVQTGRRENFFGPIELIGATITQGAPQQDGARVWIDADDVVLIPFSPAPE